MDLRYQCLDMLRLAGGLTPAGFSEKGRQAGGPAGPAAGWKFELVINLTTAEGALARTIPGNWRSWPCVDEGDRIGSLFAHESASVCVPGKRPGGGVAA